MVQNIYKKRIGIGTFKDGRYRLFVEFQSDKDVDYEWTPKWEDVCELIENAVEVERQNKPGSEYLEKFAEVCQKILTKYAPAKEVWRIKGELTSFWVSSEESKTYVEIKWRELTDRPRWYQGIRSFELGVPLSEEELKTLMSKVDVRWLIWNGKVIDYKY